MTDQDYETTPDTITPPPRLIFEGPKGPLFKALAEARKHYLSLTADATADVQLKGGGGYKHSYADLDTVIKALTPGWNEAGLAVMQFLDGDFVTTVVAKDESSLTILCPIPGYDTPQQMGSGTTYIRRYQLKAVFCVNDSEDDDASSAQGDKATVSKREPTVAKPATSVTHSNAAAAAKAKGMSGAEFAKLVYETTGNAWKDCNAEDAGKVLAAVKALEVP